MTRWTDRDRAKTETDVHYGRKKMEELTLLLFSLQHTKLKSFFDLNKVVGLD